MSSERRLLGACVERVAQRIESLEVAAVNLWPVAVDGEARVVFHIGWPVGGAMAAMLQALSKKGVDETAASPEPEHTPMASTDPTARG